MICSSCGAPLTQSPTAGFAVCDHCGAQVAVPEIVAETVDNLTDELNEVERWWNHERRPFMTPDGHGNLRPPEQQHVLHIMLMALGGILGLISAAVGHNVDWDSLGIAGFFLFPVLISLPAALLHQRAEQRYKAYQQLEAEYQGRRNAVIDRRRRRP